ncbi:hypothetical protein ABZX65_20835 [Streptomyces sp. NPDC003300]|uniref:hypothetical protein n=1 Tax=unclassified Streptomyces TaxID=2593676 RepID=UPI0033AA2F16
MSLGQDGPPTRTRMPEGHGGHGGGARRPQPRRALVTVVSIIALLVAALAFANRGSHPSSSGSANNGTAAGSGATAGSSGGGGGGGKTGTDAPTAPSSQKPVTGKSGGIPSGFAHSGEGAQSAAANYAVAMGGVEMFTADSRQHIVDTIYTPTAAAKLKGPLDQAYSADFLAKLGLDASGKAPQGKTFISRTVPVGTKTESYTADTARVSVWYMALIGMAGTGSTDPVRTDWMTWTFTLTWSGNDWKIASDAQTSGPAPVPGDVPAASAPDITKAVEEYGGFTYAR